MKNKKLFVILSPIILLLILACILLHFYATRPNDDFSKSDYKHIKIKSSWDRIYCQDFTYLVCAKTKNGYLEIYDRDLKYQTSIKLPDYKEIKLFYNDVIIIKQDGTVWQYNYEVDKDFTKIEGPSDVSEFYPKYDYCLYKDSKGDFYYIYRNGEDKSIGLKVMSNWTDMGKPQLISNLHNAEILLYDSVLVYTKDGSTYVNYYANTNKDKNINRLFDKDNNVIYHKCFEGIIYTNPVDAVKHLFLFDENRIVRVDTDDRGEVFAFEPVETHIEINIALPKAPLSFMYILDKDGKLYEVGASPIYNDGKLVLKKELLFKHKKFNKIYNNCYLYATDDKYLYKLD